MDEPYVPQFFQGVSSHIKDELIDRIYEAMNKNLDQVTILEQNDFCAVQCQQCFLHDIVHSYKNLYCGHLIPYCEADECSDLTDKELHKLFFAWIREYKLNKTIENSLEASHVKNNSDD